MKRSSLSLLDSPTWRTHFVVTGGFVGLLLVAIIWMAAGASRAEAEEPEASTTCVYHLEPIGPPSLTNTITAQPVARGCYSNTASAMNAASIAADVLIGEDWGHIEFGGANILWTASTGCGANNWQLTSMPAEWDNRVRSAKSFSGCNHYKHFELAGFGGAVFDCGGQCASMGPMAAQTSSEKWQK